MWSTAHDGMSDFHSLAERLGFSFCRYLFLKKTCLLFDNCLTFDSLFRPIRQVFFFYVACLEEQQQGKNIQYCHFPQAFQRQSFATAINIRYRECCAHFLTFHLCLFFSLCFFFFFGLTQSVKTSSLPSTQEKSLSQCQKCQPPNLTAALPQCEPSPLHFSAVLRFSSAGCTEALCFFPLGHCRYIFIVSECVLL